MTDTETARRGEPEGPAGPGDQDVPGRRLLLTFEAFRTTHHQEWLHYARLRAGSSAEAVGAVDATCAHLAANWAHVLRQPSVAAYAWAALREHLAARSRTRLHAARHGCRTTGSTT